MRILVGTLYTIENEYEACLTAVQQQTHSPVEQFVIANQPNKQAHDALYRTFMEWAADFDLFIKVDADMVLRDNQLFAKIVTVFNQNAWLQNLEIAVQDFFTDQLIWGMHSYRSSVRWQLRQDNIFVDARPVLPEQRLMDKTDLAPAADHCPDPSPFQAFHYGVHRAVKIVQPDRWRVNHSQARFHWQNLQRVKQLFQTTQDKRLGWAVLGAELVFKGGIGPREVNADNPYLDALFKPYAVASATELAAKIAQLENGRFAFLPPSQQLNALLARFRWRHWRGESG